MPMRKPSEAELMERALDVLRRAADVMRCLRTDMLDAKDHRHGQLDDVLYDADEVLKWV